MNSRPGGPLSQRPARRSAGGLGGAGQQLPLLLGGAVVAVLIVVAVIVLAGRCSGSASANSDCSKKPPPPPSGFAYASPYCIMRASVGKQGYLTVPLTDHSATRGLNIYGYSGGTWQRLSAAAVTPDGLSAVSTGTYAIPPAVAVFRSNGNLQVYGTLPKGVPPSADAVPLMSVEVPAVFTPLADASISGTPVVVTPNQSFDTMPEVVAESQQDAQVAGTLLADDTRRNAHVDRIAASADQGSWAGVVIDYPNVDPGLKSNFSAFVQALATRLHASQRRLVLRLPLPRHEGSDWNSGAYDWPALAKSADGFILIAEHDQSIYRSRVPDAVKYLVTQVGDSHKLVLELTPFSEEKSETGALDTLTTQQALSIAGQITVRNPDAVYTSSDVVVSADNINRDNGSGLQWTPQGVLSFVYKNGNEQRTVWVENQFSAGYKLEIAELYKLGGVSVDYAGGDPSMANIWPAIAQFQAAGQPTLLQPNPDALRPRWLTDNQPIPDAGVRALFTWRTPAAPGNHILTVLVSDGIMRVQESTTVTVKVAPPGTPTQTPVAPQPTRTSNIAPTKAPSSTGR